MDTTLLEEIKENEELVTKLDNLTILYYDVGITSVTKLHKQLAKLQEALGTQVIAIPKQFDLMLNCSADQLIQLKQIIDTALSIKLEQENELHMLSFRDNSIKYTS